MKFNENCLKGSGDMEAPSGHETVMGGLAD